MNPPADPDRLPAVAANLGVGRATRHVFLCADPTKPKCAPPEVGREVWSYLKRRLGELGLDGKVAASRSTEGGARPCVLRTKADCLRICRDGPICVVYPDGVWYHAVTVPVMERILTEHLLGDRVVEEHVIVRAPLGGPGGPVRE